MKITMLGTGTSIIQPQRNSAAVLLETDDGQAVVVDCGWGVPKALTSLDFPGYRIDHLCITHRHADHMTALPGLIQSIYVDSIYYPEHTPQLLTIHGYPGFQKDFNTLIEMMAPDMGNMFPINIIEHPAASPYTREGLRITSTEVHHVNYFPALSFRFEHQGKSVVVSGDLGWDERILPLLENADLAIIESTIWPAFFAEQGPRPNHLSAFECGQMAAKAGVKHLVLTHLHEKATAAEFEAEARKSYQGRVTVPQDLDVIEI